MRRIKEILKEKYYTEDGGRWGKKKFLEKKDEKLR